MAKRVARADHLRYSHSIATQPGDTQIQQAILHLKAFFLGMFEFRTSWTTSYDDYDLMETYDMGRELAHRLTFRKFEE